MAYLIKFTLNGDLWSWCYAADLRRVETSLVVQHPQVPRAMNGRVETCTLFGGPKHSFPLKFGWTHAFRIPWKSWITGGQQVPRHHLPSWIPESVQDAGVNACIDYAIRGSGLLSVFAKDPIRLAVAEDMALEEAEVWIRTPQFVPANDKEMVTWAAKRPQMDKVAREDADRVVAEAGLSGYAAAIRHLVRREAHRKLDSKDEFSATQCLGGEPWFPSNTDPVVKFGNLKKAEYPMSANANPTHRYVGDEQLLRALEDNILPGPDDWNERARRLTWQQKFTSWDTTNPLPSIGYRHWIENESMPGFSRRLGMTGMGAEYSSIGLLCLISEPAKEYLSTLALTPPPAEACMRYALRQAWLS